MRDPRERLLDMIEAIENIERYVACGREDFERSELIQIWVVHHLQIIGEAAARLDREFQEKHAGIPWADVVAMRNILVHEYFGVDLEEVWQAATRDLPVLKQSLNSLMGHLFP